MNTERRAAELFDQYKQDIYRRTDRLFAGLMGLQWIAGIVFAVWVSPLTWVGARQPHAPARLGGGRPRRHHLALPRRPRAGAAGPAVDPLHHRHGADADGRAPHPPHGRPDRNALPRLRLARLPRLLPRLARPRARDDRRGPRPLPARRSSGRNRSTAWSSPASGAGSSTRRGSSSKTSSSSSRACAWRRRDAAAGRAHGGPRAGGPDPAAGRARRVADGGRRPGPDARQPNRR